MKRSQLSAKSYLYLKEVEARRINENKNEETKRGLKVAFIFLTMAGAFAIIILSITICSYLLG